MQVQSGEHRKFILIASVVLVLIWGTAFTLVGYAVDYVSPAWIVAARTSIATIILAIYTHMRGHRFPKLSDPRWFWYLGMGVIGMTIPFALVATGQKEVDSGLAAILVGFMPMITIVLAHFFVKGEHLTPRKSLGFFVGFIGIIMLFLPIPFKFELIDQWRPQSLMLMGAVCYALVTIIAKRAPDTPASLGGTIMLIGASLSAIAYALTTGIPSQMPPIGALAALLALAVGSTAIAQILYLRLIQVAGPSYIAKINYATPVCSLIAGILFLGEDFSWRAVFAVLIIVCGLFIARAKIDKS